MNVLGLFSGIGGFELGFERAGCRIVGVCEVDPYCRAVLKKHWPGVYQFGDVRTVTKESCDLLGIEPDIITGGFPCQDISLAGKGAGLSGERSGLWTEFHRVIAELRPAYAVIENVSALRARGLDQVLGSLAAIGYDAEWHCIPASAVGAPHRRDRVWIVAYPVIDGSGSRRTEREGQQRRTPLISASGEMADPPRILSGRQEQRSIGERIGAGGESIIVADTPCKLLDGTGPTRPGWRRQFTNSDWWLTEPDVGRVAHGVPARVDRLRALGNAVVPQIPEIIARAILTGGASCPAQNAED